MLKNKYQLYELICVAVLAVFVTLMLVFSSAGTNKTVQELTAPVTKLGESAALTGLRLRSFDRRGRAVL